MNKENSPSNPNNNNGKGNNKDSTSNTSSAKKKFTPIKRKHPDSVLSKENVPEKSHATKGGKKTEVAKEKEKISLEDKRLQGPITKKVKKN